VTAKIVPLPKRKPETFTAQGAMNWPMPQIPPGKPILGIDAWKFSGGVDDLWPSPDHWRSLDPPRDIKATGDRSDET
jgi:hypothetical protein